jgi:hypothetical protein
MKDQSCSCRDEVGPAIRPEPERARPQLELLTAGEIPGDAGRPGDDSARRIRFSLFRFLF